MRQLERALTLGCLLVLVLAAGCAGVGIDPTPSGTENPTQSGPPAIDVAVERVDATDRVSFQLTASPAAADVEEFRIALKHGTVVDSSGFTKETTAQEGFSGDVYRWDGETTRPRMQFETRRQGGQSRDYSSTEDWYFGETPFVQSLWLRSGDTEYSNAVVLGKSESDVPRSGNVSVAPEGVVGEQYLYIGPYTEKIVTEGESSFRFIEGGNASVTDHESIGQEFVQAQPYLRGKQPGQLTVFVMPDPMLERGMASPLADEFWIHQNRTRSEPANIWLHEYIHTQQTQTNFGDRMQWYPEGVTTYQTAVLSSQVGLVSADDSRVYLSQKGFDDVVLADQETWSGTDAEYYRGSTVLFALDSQIRSVSGGEATIQDVIVRVQHANGGVTYESFREMVVAESSADVGEWLDTYVLTSDQPEPPDELLEFPESSRVEPLVDEPAETVSPGDGMETSSTLTSHDSGGESLSLQTPFVWGVLGGTLLLIGILGVVRTMRS